MMTSFDAFLIDLSQNDFKKLIEKGVKIASLQEINSKIFQNNFNKNLSQVFLTSTKLKYDLLFENVWQFIFSAQYLRFRDKDRNLFAQGWIILVIEGHFMSARGLLNLYLKLFVL